MFHHHFHLDYLLFLSDYYLLNIQHHFYHKEIIYHIYLQNGGGGGGSCAIDVPCDLKYVDIFGFISIPVMASTGFLTIFLALLYYDLSREEIVE